MPTTVRRLLAAALPMLLLPALAAPLVACHDDTGADGLVSQQALDAMTTEALAALDEGAGIVLPESVPVLLLTAAEARERRRAYVADLDEDSGFTVAVDFMADAMFGDRMLGRYLPDEQVIYVIEDVVVSLAGGDRDLARELLFPVLAHELVHAYDDQVYGCVPDPSELTAVMEDPGAVLDIHTQMSLLEGRASYASQLACDVAGVEALPKPDLDRARNAVMVESDGSVGMDVLAGLGNGIGRMKLVQYVQGWEFAEAAHAYGGEPFFRHVFGHLPLSMEELEDFDVFVVRWAEEMEAALDAEEDAPAPPPEPPEADA